VEADWGAEVGPDLPSIDVPWEGFVDLRLDRLSVQTIEEAALHPALSEALTTLNSPAPGLFTSKCDTWTLDSSEIDPDEFSALAEDAGEGFASYIDILQVDPVNFSSFEFHERWVRNLTQMLKVIAIFNGRVELIVRAAIVNQDSGYGLTVYALGCGADLSAAYNAWQSVLRAAVTATIS
jgi:hypothetical protein